MAKAQWSVARVTDESERKSGSSDFISLDEGEKFLGYFLGEADPKIDDKAYFEYKVHWINNGSVPCAGENCPMCEDGDRPRTKAMTLWLVTQDERGNELGKNGEGELRIYDMSISVIKQFTELRSEDEKIKGRLFRVSRPDEKTYLVLPKQDFLKATQVKELLKSDGAPDFEQMLTSKLRKAMEGTALARAMEDDDDPPPARGKGAKKAKPDDDDDDDDKSKGKGKSKPKDEPEDDEDELPEEGAGVEVVVKKVNDENWIMVERNGGDAVKVWGTAEVDVTDLVKGQVIAITYVTDDDDDFVLTEDPETKPDDDGDGDKGDLPESIEDVTFKVAGIDADNQTIDVENDDHSFTLWFLDQGPGSDVDFDDYEEGDEITVSAEKDGVGDMVATAVPEKAGKKKKAAGKGAKGGKKGGKGK